jgi:AbrB family looped-hinge helix DNA binding protein
METVKLSARGQIVIPKAIRDAGHWLPGAEFKISLVGAEIRIRPVDRVIATELDAVAGCLQRPGRSLLDDEHTQKAIAEMLAMQDRASRA